MMKARTGGKPRKITKKYGTSQWGEAWIRLKRDKKAMMGLVIICILLCCALVPSILAPYGLDEQRPAEALQWPNLLHLMGTDNFGRDIFSRIIYGARTSIVVGFIAVGFACITGTLIGAAAGYYGGKADNVLMPHGCSYGNPQHPAGNFYCRGPGFRIGQSDDCGRNRYDSFLCQDGTRLGPYRQGSGIY